MSGLYNMIFGVNPMADVLLAVLGLERSETGRFRDCNPSADGTTITLLTRNGGPNRPGYSEFITEIKAHPFFRGDRDDEYDETFQIVEFNTPPDYVMMAKDIARKFGETRPLREKFEKFMTDLKDGKDTPEVRRGMEAGKAIFAQLQSGKSGTVSMGGGAVDVVAMTPPKDKEP